MERSDRIHTLSQALADQIAAGEVVERPASVVKELVENSVDAGALRIDVELEDAGMGRIRVLDNGRGLHRDDLHLSVRRHATSKIRRVEELTEIHTLGFRGEALASIAAVAHLTVRSRTREGSVGHQLVVRGGQVGEVEEVGMPQGTQVEVANLFASVPARRKFVRAEATEVGHVMDCIVHVALVKPSVSFSLSHGKRRLLSFAATDQAQRVAQVLDRRGRGPYHEFEGESGGVRVYGWLGHPDHAGRQRRGPYLVVRQRVIRDRNLTQILSTAYGGLIDGKASPVAFIGVEPPSGTVDVNVHPQKSEVRFADNQGVYAATRKIITEAVERTGWAAATAERTLGDAGSERALDAVLVGSRAAEASSVGARWSGSTRARTGLDTAGSAPSVTGGRGTAATSRPYQLHTAHVGAGETSSVPTAERSSPARTGQAHAPEGTETLDAPRLLTVLQGPVAVFEHRDQLLAVDLRRLRAHLVQSQLLAELGEGRVQAQQLLRPVVVTRPPQQLDALLRSQSDLAGFGIDVAPFGDGALVVRGVPASLGLVESDDDVEVLLDKVVAWAQLRVRSSASETSLDREGIAEMVASAAGVPTETRNAAQRLAKRWLRELESRGVAPPFEGVPGISAWSSSALVTAGSRGRTS